MFKKALSTIALLTAAATSFADCTIDVEVGDALAYSTSAIEVPASCETVTVNIKHTGTLPAMAMGHNWVLATDADWESVAADGSAAGFEGNFLPAGDDRVIAATRLVGGGESDSVTFSTSGLDATASYTFFCSFPGHWSIMKGSFKLI